MHEDRVADFRYFNETNIQIFRKSLQQIHNVAYRDYCTFVLNDQMVQDDWLQLMGFKTTIGMTYQLLQEALTPHQIRQTAVFSGALNTLYIYETMSDNVALGIIDSCMTQAAQDRQEILRFFSEATIAKLSGDTRTPEELLAPIQQLCDQVSLFDQSLNAKEHQRIFTYYQSKKTVARKDVEFSLYDILLNNMHCAMIACQQFDGMISHDYFLDSLRRRYQGQLFLLVNQTMTLDQALDASIGSIAAVPAMFYYIAYYLEVLEPNRQYPTILQSGLLMQAMDYAALVVRLLNDVGTQLLHLGSRETTQWQTHFIEQLNTHPNWSFRQLLDNETRKNPALFARFHKDLMFGEFNLVLQFVPTNTDTLEKIEGLFDQIAELQRTYHNTLAELEEILQSLEKTLGNPIVRHVVMAFIVFHQKLYNNTFQIPSGEYAI